MALFHFSYNIFDDINLIHPPYIHLVPRVLSLPSSVGHSHLLLLVPVLDNNNNNNNNDNNSHNNNNNSNKKKKKKKNNKSLSFIYLFSCNYISFTKSTEILYSYTYQEHIMDF